MGLANSERMDWEDLGISRGSGRYVCGNCVGDRALAEFIAENAAETECEYCGAENQIPFACGIDEVVKFMAEIISEEWTDPVHELPYDGGEGGYLGRVFDAEDLFTEIGFNTQNADVYEDISACFSNGSWCRRNYADPTPAEQHRWGWKRFCREVKFARRYTFWSSLGQDDEDDDNDCPPPGMMLAEIKNVMASLSLIRELPAGYQLWRVRPHSAGEVIALPFGFTSPPLKDATQPNRMSPSGVSMFYGTDDFETAVLEVASSGYLASGVRFEACRPLQILDLVYMHQREQEFSYFSTNGRQWRHQFEFLRFFSKDVARPLERDQPHIDYVPTQVFTEYVRYHVQTAAGHAVNGIRYSSSKNQRPCYVLFCDADDCLKSRDHRPQVLSFVPDSLRTINLQQNNSPAAVGSLANNDRPVFPISEQKEL